MVNFRSKKLVFLVSILVFALQAMAQQDHFVYLQTDNGQPFYVRMNHQILSSSSEGYIIIPNITSGVYQIKVGFPKKEHPEEAFTVSVDDNNEGFLIKHFEDKGLQLFNLETLALISGDKDTSAQIAVSTQDNNPFTKMLANVVKDSTILQNHEVNITNIPASPDTASATKDVAVSVPGTADSASNKPVAEIANEDNASESAVTVVSPPNDSSTSIEGDTPVSKILSRKDEKGLQLIYADRNGQDKDTVRVFMPSVKSDSSSNSEATNNNNFDFAENKNVVKNSVDTSQLTITPTIIEPEKEQTGFVLREDTPSAAADSETVTKTKTAPEQVFYIGPKEKKDNDIKEKPADEKKGLFSGISASENSEKETVNTEKKPVNKIEVLPKVVTSSTVNSDCKEFAENQDFLRLRKKMASEDNKEDMIKAARKSFRSKCFSTAQIKDLSYLFLTDEGKYMFFDAAYPHTSDSDQYGTLELQLKDPYYKSRFEAMIRH
jgi:hypothetical protein